MTATYVQCGYLRPRTTIATAHNVRRDGDARGHVAICSCGWRIRHVHLDIVRDATNRHTNDRRDQT